MDVFTLGVGYMEVGDIVLTNAMKRYIVLDVVKPPSKEYQIVEFGKEYQKQDWCQLVCIRFGGIILCPEESLRLLKKCEKHEFIQAIENAKPDDRVHFSKLKKCFDGYKCSKLDAGSIFIK